MVIEILKEKGNKCQNINYLLIQASLYNSICKQEINLNDKSEFSNDPLYTFFERSNAMLFSLFCK